MYASEFVDELEYLVPRGHTHVSFPEYDRIVAGGVMTAPMLGHGCVCNYPMFASLGLYHCPEIDQYRPAAVMDSWGNQAEELFAEMR
jgi:hypothetical protein